VSATFPASGGNATANWPPITTSTFPSVADDAAALAAKLWRVLVDEYGEDAYSVLLNHFPHDERPTYEAPWEDDA
jgi:hypothetical protein